MKLALTRSHPRTAWPSPLPSHVPPPSSTSQVFHPTPSALIPAITPRSEPNVQHSQVVVDLNTLVTIQNFTRFYPGVPSTSFQPIYYALDDGSLLAPPLMVDLRFNNIYLIITGCLLTVFLRNIWEATLYIWRGKVRKKGLLYTVLISQILGPIAIIAIIAAQFTRSAICTVVMRIVGITTGVSLSFLVTGILGVKAYMCLDGNPFILVGLVALRTAGSIVLAMDLVSLEGLRSLSGRCYRASDGLSSVFILLLLTESFFICGCFFYAVWKSRGSAAVRGRISMQLSLDDVAHSQHGTQRIETADSIRTRRGWWDYVPPAETINPFSSPRIRQSSLLSYERSIPSTRRGASQRLGNHDVEGSVEVAQLSTNPLSPPQPTQPTMARTSVTLDERPFPRREPVPFKRPTSPAPSYMSRFSRCIPKMALFREVMRDELWYTAVITAFTVVSAAMTLIGVKTITGFNSCNWIALDWALISLLVMHSFGRVVRRHENEFLLHQPSAWYRDVYTDPSTAELLRDRPRPTRTEAASSRTRARCSYGGESGLPRSELSTRHLFPSNSRADLHSVEASTSGSSSVFSPLETDSFSRMNACSLHIVDGERVPTASVEDISPGSSQSQKSPGHWYNSSLSSSPPLPDPPDDIHSFHMSTHAHVS